MTKVESAFFFELRLVTIDFDWSGMLYISLFKVVFGKLWVWISKKKQAKNAVVLPDGKEGLEFKHRGLTFSVILKTVQFGVIDFCKFNI